MTLLRWFSNLRIRFKLLISYSLVFCLSLTLCSTILYSFVRRTIENNIESELKNSTATILNMVRTAANVSIKNHLRAVAEKNREIAEYFYQQAQQGLITDQLARETARNVFLTQTIGKTGYIYCIDSKGMVLIHPKNSLIGVDISEHAFVIKQKQEKVGYLEYDWKNPGETETRPKALYMTYFAPWDWIISASSYRSEFNELVNPEDFRQSILSLQFGETGYCFLLDTLGNLIIHPTSEGNFHDARDSKGRMFVRDICAQKNGKIFYTWVNPGSTVPREKLVIFNDIPEFNWIVASSSYMDEFYAPLKTVRRIFVATVLISLMLVLALTFRISASITNPLRELMRRFSEGAGGDISVRMQCRSGDEMGLLAGYFNLFMERLEAYSENLKTEIAVRKRAEAAISKSEANYRELVQNANSIILRIDTNGTITFFNEYAQRFFGYSEAEILGGCIIGTLVPETQLNSADLKRIIETVNRHPEQYRYHELKTLRRNGEQAWVAWTNKAVRDVAGTITEYLCIGTDVTEVRASEHEMNRMRLYLKNVVDSMPSLLVGVDMKGRITQWNREAEHVTGILEESALGKHVLSVMPQLIILKPVFERAITEKTPQKIEKKAYPVNGATRYADMLVYPLMVNGVEGAVIRVDDVTARVRMEELMVQSEKMLSVGGLAAGMAHEINNPLGGILQSLQNILRRLSPDLSANVAAAVSCGTDLGAVRRYLEEREILKFIDSIRISGERASATVEDMLNFSRRSESRATPVDLASLLDKTVELATHDYDLKKKFDFRRIQIIREFSPDMDEVSCVATEIEQVILNLLRNAAQAMMLAGTPAPVITLRVCADADYAVIQVADNGPGMSEETCKRAFEPFFTTKEVGIGTGLGLSVSYFIVTNNHNGAMSVDSSPGNGTCFVIRLPWKGIRSKE
ncbi:MAG: cache domain-containing protein [Pseudomonadota bacterium]